MNDMYDEAARIGAKVVASDAARSGAKVFRTYFYFASVDDAVEAFRDVMPEARVRAIWNAMPIEDGDE
jgi:hypothetical protein